MCWVVGDNVSPAWQRSALKALRVGGFPNLRVPFWGPHSKGYSILGSILGSHFLGKPPVHESKRRPEQDSALFSPRLEMACLRWAPPCRDYVGRRGTWRFVGFREFVPQKFCCHVCT